MKEHGILFKPGMIKAVLELRKTQTRRIIQPQPDHKQIHVWKGKTVYDGEHRLWWWKDKWWDQDFEMKEQIIKLSKYQPGDLLYIKEGFCQDYAIGGADKNMNPINIIYKMDTKDGEFVGKWTSPLFMPKSAARTWLKVKSVRAERIQDISEADSLADGGWEYENCPFHKAPEKSFHFLWDSINAKPKPHKVDGVIGYYTSYPWEEDIKQGDAYKGKPLIQYPNPWVYVYEFEIFEYVEDTNE